MSAGWKSYTPLLKKKGREAAGQFLIEGVRLCREGLQSGWTIEACFISETFSRGNYWPDFRHQLAARQLETVIVGDAALKRLSDTETPQGIVMVMALPEFFNKEPNYKTLHFSLLLSAVRDPGNLGTLIRIADWYDVDGIVLSSDCVDPLSGKVLRSTMGSFFHVPVYTAPLAVAVEKLQAVEATVIAAAADGSSEINDLALKPPLALLLGGEAHGIPAALQNKADIIARIKRYGRAESLNVAIAGGILADRIAGAVYRSRAPSSAKS